MFEVKVCCRLHGQRIVLRMVFNLFLKHCGNEHPLLLVMDNHDSDFCLEVFQKTIGERVRKTTNL